MTPPRWSAAALVVAWVASGCSWGEAPSSTEAEGRRKEASREERGRPKAARPALTDVQRAQPNVLVVVLDTVRADRMSLYGYAKPTTPKLTAWAADARVYDHAMSPGVWTLPSHASLFTGLPERSHGVTADHNWLDGDHVTVAEGLYDAGYDTWTFCANPYLAHGTNLLQGFAEQAFPWEPPWRSAVEAHMRGKLDPRDVSNPLAPAYRGRGGADTNRYLFKEAGPVAAQAFDRWLGERAEADRPFLAFINLMEAHLPRIPSAEARKAVMTEAEIEAAWTLEQSTIHFHEWMVGARPYTPSDLNTISAVYDASLVDVDAAAMAVLDALARRGLDDETIVIVTSDHGENLGDHNLLLHKYAVYDTLARVPLVVRWPGHIAPGRVAEASSVGEVLWQLASEGSLPLPETTVAAWKARPGVSEGVVTSFDAVADGSIRRMKRLHPGHGTEALERTYLALTQGTLKVIEGSDGSVELFDLAADPMEANNLSKARPADFEAMRGRLGRWKEAVPTWTPREAGSGKRNDELTRGLEAIGYVE